MAQLIQNYRPPGTYGRIIPNPTTTTASGPPVVAIVGPALRGRYDAYLVSNTDDSQLEYGLATKSNPLSLGIQIAFENGAQQVLAVNVQPLNSTNSYIGTGGAVGIPISSLPTTLFTQAASSVMDAVTNAPVNLYGGVAGTFYIQDFNPQVADPILNSTTQSTQAAFSLSGSASLLQYVRNGPTPLANSVQQVPLANSNMVQVPVLVNTFTPPATSISGNTWNQLQNAFMLRDSINSAFQTPAQARIFIPDASQTTYSPTGYRRLSEAVGVTSGINTTADAYAAAIAGGFVRIQAIEAGSQHELVLGLFSNDNAGNPLTYGLPTAGGSNPYVLSVLGTNGTVTQTSYINAITQQLTVTRADVIVVLNTDPGIQNTLKDHVTFMSSYAERNERIALVSGPTSEIYTQSIANAQALQGGVGAKRMVYVFPTAAYRFDPVQRQQVLLDGSYICCALAGIITSNGSSEPLTHKTVSGFKDIALKLGRGQLNTIAQNGITVIENNPTFGLWVRHGITCDPSTPENLEISVVRQLDYVMQNLRDVMDANVIAKKMNANTIAAVESLARIALQKMSENSVIEGFQNLSARVNINDPRQIDVRFSAKPSYPLDYVELTMSVTQTLDTNAAAQF